MGDLLWLWWLRWSGRYVVMWKNGLCHTEERLAGWIVTLPDSRRSPSLSQAAAYKPHLFLNVLFEVPSKGWPQAWDL